MPIFKKKDIYKKENTPAKDKTAGGASVRGAAGEYYGHILRNPRITEKGTDLSIHNAYVFDVDPRANKKDVVSAIRDVYGVTPVKVRTITIPRKAVSSRGKKGIKSGGKKAIVYLKKGDKIEFV